MPLLAIIGLIVTGFLEILIGAVVLIRSRQNPINVAFFIMVVSISIWTLLIAFFGLTDNHTHALIAARGFYIAGAAVGVMYFVFGQVCVRRASVMSFSILAPLILLGLFSTWFILDPTILHTELVYVEYGKLIILNKAGYTIYSVLFSAVFISGLTLLLLGRRLSKDKAGKDMSSLGFYTLPGGIASITTNVLLPWFDNYQYIWIGPLLILIFVMGTGYQLVTRRLFDVKPVIARSVIYIIVAVLFFAIYTMAVVLLASSDIAGLNASTSQAVTLAILSTLISLLFHPIKTILNKTINKLLYRSTYSVSAEIGSLGKDLLRNTDPENVLANSIVFINKTLQTRNTKIIHLKDNPVAAQIRMLNKPVYSVDFSINETLNSYLSSLHSVAIIDVSSDASETYVAIGEKKSGIALSGHDLKFLRAASYEIAIAHDNARKHSTIEELNSSLEHKIKVATQQLRKANRKLTDLDQAKDEFFSMASHQLRSPVSATAQAIWLLENTDASDTELTEELIATAKESSIRMASLVEDMFSSAKLSTGVLKIKRSDTDLSRLLATRVKIAQQSAANKKQLIALTIPDHVTNLGVDSAAIREILANFLENAIKYSPSDSTINVSLENEDRCISIRISDQGIGVPTEDQPLLFTKLFRASNAIEAREGTGLGLFLAKQIIELHNGEIIFESVVGEGSVFGFRVPR